VCALILVSCSGTDVTTLDTPEGQPGGAGSETSPPDSQTLELLAEPETVDVTCRWIGALTRNLPRGSDPTSTCEAVVEDCKGALGGLGTLSGVTLPDSDLSGLLGCPLTFSELDACLADILTGARESYTDSLGCSPAASTEALDALSFAATPACFIAALRCPELLTQLGG
jgi:hypothetical protein